MGYVKLVGYGVVKVHQLLLSLKLPTASNVVLTLGSRQFLVVQAETTAMLDAPEGWWMEISLEGNGIPTSGMNFEITVNYEGLEHMMILIEIVQTVGSILGIIAFLAVVITFGCGKYSNLW